MIRPLISVVIPMWNREAYIAEAIGSVLAQGWQPLEIIVVDDGSTDRSVEAALQAAPELVLVRQSNRGIGAARNAGVRRAGGDLLAFVDSDDRWTPGKLVRQFELLESRPDLDMVFGRVRQFHSPAHSESSPEPEPSAGPVCGSMLIRASAFHRVGCFAENVRVGEFIDWYARAMSTGLRAVMQPEVVLERRIHNRNTAVVKPESARDYARVLKAVLDRKRAAQRLGVEGGA